MTANPGILKLIDIAYNGPSLIIPRTKNTIPTLDGRPEADHAGPGQAYTQGSRKLDIRRALFTSEEGETG